MFWIAIGVSHLCSVTSAQPPRPGDYSPAQYEVVEERDLDAPMRDGVKLKIDIFRPKAAGRFPAVLQQTPYNKSGQAARARNSASRGYDTPELQEDVEIVGPITARVFAATSALDTDWMIRLSDVHPDGRALFLAEGVMRARHRDPDNDGAFNPNKLSTIEPDRPYEYTIEFWRPTGNMFARGHRIRIEISSSYYPYYLRNPNAAEDNIGLATKFHIANQTVFHDTGRPSHVVLPVIPVEDENLNRKQ